jgi:preprotein translocase subunit SecY
MWLGEQITERGIGNGMSLLIFTGIVVGLPRGITDLYGKYRDAAWGAFTPIAILILIVAMVAVVAFIVFVERSERRIPVQYAKRIVGRKMMGGQSTHLPLRVNSGGVMPVIFASSILSVPLLLTGRSFFGSAKIEDTGFFGPILRNIAPGEPWYEILQITAIIFFAYFYISIVFRPDDIADNMRKYGGFIPGIRPGRRTSEFINDVLTRITLVGALYLVHHHCHPDVSDQRYPLQPSVADRRFLRPVADVDDERTRCELLLRRHLAADRRRRSHGHGAAGRIATHHAPLRRLLSQEWPHPRPAQLVGPAR